MNYFLSLGSNLGRRRRNLARALAALDEAGVRVRQVSSVYRTQPVGFIAQPWFFNLAAAVETRLQPAELLRLTRRIEEELGRTRKMNAGPRPIDIDILLAGRQIIGTLRLKVPHPRLEKRNFVLFPLDEIASNAVHPVLRKKIHSLLKTSTDPSRVIKLQGIDLAGYHSRRGPRPRRATPPCPLGITRKGTLSLLRLRRA